jgi:hypothetical protein
MKPPARTLAARLMSVAWAYELCRRLGLDAAPVIERSRRRRGKPSRRSKISAPRPLQGGRLPHAGTRTPLKGKKGDLVQPGRKSFAQRRWPRHAHLESAVDVGAEERAQPADDHHVAQRRTLPLRYAKPYFRSHAWWERAAFGPKSYVVGHGR